MKSRISITKKEICIFGGIIGVITLAGLVYVKLKKNVSKKEEDTQKSDLKPGETEIKETSDNKKPEKRAPKQQGPVEFTDPEDLIKYILETEIEKADFASADDFISGMISIGLGVCSKDDWFGYFPKNKEELVAQLVNYRLLEKYDAIVYNNYKNKN